MSAQIQFMGGWVLVQNVARPEGRCVLFDNESWVEFIERAKAGEYDLPMTEGATT